MDSTLDQNEKSTQPVTFVRVRVRLCGAFRQCSPAAEVSFEVPPGITVSGVREYLTEALHRQCPSFDAGDLVKASALAAGQEILDESQPLVTGAGEVRLAILPPVCGG